MFCEDGAIGSGLKVVRDDDLLLMPSCRLVKLSESAKIFFRHAKTPFSAKTRSLEIGNISRSCYALSNYEKELWEWWIQQSKTQLACILEADESTRLRMGNSLPNHHEDHVAGKGDNSLQHYNLVHKFLPMPQALKIPGAKAAVDKEWEKLDKISAWNLKKSEVRNK